MSKEGIKVFISLRDSVCDECKEDLGHGAWVMLAGDKGALCLSCGDLDHLVFLPSGNMTLTRRSRKNSILSAIVLKWSRSRKRYERQGLLVEEAAFKKAEEECLVDQEAKAHQREREKERREILDQRYVHDFAMRIREIYPRCPVNVEMTIAQHSCRKYSGRVGRSATAKEFDQKAVQLAVGAYVRHEHTPYDTLLAKGYDRADARHEVKHKVEQIFADWVM